MNKRGTAPTTNYYILKDNLTSAKGSVPLITILERNLSMPTGDDNCLFSASKAAYVMWYAESAAYPVWTRTKLNKEH